MNPVNESLEPKIYLFSFDELGSRFRDSFDSFNKNIITAVPRLNYIFIMFLGIYLLSREGNSRDRTSKSFIDSRFLFYILLCGCQ